MTKETNQRKSTGTNKPLKANRILSTVAMVTSLALTVSSCGGGGGGSTTPSNPPITISPPPPPPPPSGSLIDRAKTFPAMPKDSSALARLLGRQGGFASGTPFNDLEFTLFDTDYMDGETNGYDTFMPVDPSSTTPGADQVKIVSGTGNLDLNAAYDGDQGDRVILGTADHPSPFFLRGADGNDNDWLVLTNFDYRFGHVQLKGSAGDYGLVYCALADGCATTGYYLFHTAGSQPDLVAFIFPCDDIALPVSGNAPRNARALCNSSGTLSLTDANQFKFAPTFPVSSSIASGATQLGSSGKEIVAGTTMDRAGNLYLVGQTDGILDATTQGDNKVFVARLNVSGGLDWVKEFPLVNGSLLFDATTDADYIYAVGRTLGALPGFTNRGRWDGIILKLRLSDGATVATHQYGTESLDGYGTVTLDDAGNLYVSGAGAPDGPASTDSDYLVAKHRSSDLSMIWRQVVTPQATGQIFVAEAWGGLTYIPGAAPGAGRLVTAGWYMSAGGANGFIDVWDGLNATTPNRATTTTISSPNNQADWVLDTAADATGAIYGVGYTTGNLQGTHQGLGDAFIVKYDANLRNPVFRQIGSPQSDMFRRVKLDSTGALFAVGYSYGNLGGANADTSLRTGDVFVQKFTLDLSPLQRLQFGTAGEDRGFPAFRPGELGVGGMTEGALGGTSRGSFDGYGLRIDTATLTIKR